jgi:hypothetical protein
MDCRRVADILSQPVCVCVFKTLAWQVGQDWLRCPMQGPGGADHGSSSEAPDRTSSVSMRRGESDASMVTPVC